MRAPHALAMQGWPGGSVAGTSLRHEVFKWALVAGIHALVLAFLLHPAARDVRHALLAPLEVRLLELPPPERPRPPPPRKPAAAPQVTAPPPVLTAAAESAPAASFTVAPQPPLPREVPATARIEPRAAPAPVVDAPPAPPPPLPVTAARFDADYLNNPPPVYPSISRRLREEGQVLLSVQVSAEGTAAAVHVRQGSGFARLDEAAIAAVRQWRFVPARRGTQAIASTVLVPIQFTLRGT